MPPFHVVMKELDNPRGLAFGDDGALYVAEAGSGGAAPAPPCEEHDKGAGKLTFYISNCGTCGGSGGVTGSGEVIRIRP